MKQKIRILTKKNCKEDIQGEAHLDDNIIYICPNRIKNKKEIPSIIAHERAHLRFDYLLKTKPKSKLINYSDAVLNSPVFSSDLKRMKKGIKNKFQRGKYIDEYFAQTKELRHRLRIGLEDPKRLRKEYDIAEKNLRLLS